VGTTATPSVVASVTATPSVVAAVATRDKRDGGGGQGGLGGQNGGGGLGGQGGDPTSTSGVQAQATQQGTQVGGKTGKTDGSCLTGSIDLLTTPDALTTIWRNIGVILGGGLLGTMLFYAAMGFVVKKRMSS